MAARSPVDVIQRDFSGGEISTRMLMRDDTVVYQKSAVAMRNFLPTMTGSVERTRGTRFLRQLRQIAHARSFSKPANSGSACSARALTRARNCSS